MPPKKRGGKAQAAPKRARSGAAVAESAPKRGRAGATMAVASAKPRFWLSGQAAYPEGAGDVPAAALALAVHSHQPFALCSRETATTPACALHLEHLQGMTLNGTSLIIEAGVTIEKLSAKLEELKKKGKLQLNAPLKADGKRTVLGSILTESPEESPGLKAAVTELHVVLDDKIERTTLGEYKAKRDGSGGIVVEVVIGLIPIEAGPPVLGRWYVLSTGHTFDLPGNKIPEDATVILGKADHGVPIAVIRVEGDKQLDLPKPANWTITPATSHLLMSQQKNELFELTCGATLKRQQSIENVRDVNYVALFAGVAQVGSQVVVKVKGKKVTVFYNEEQEIDDANLRRLFPRPGPPPPSQPPSGVHPMYRTRGLTLAATPPTKKKGLTLPTPLPNPTIPNFLGEVYDQKHPMYAQARQQYATSSYDKEMYPKYVAYPTNEDDVVRAILFAKQQKIPVMGRSGGHQYDGVSCDNGALVLRMDHFTKIEIRDLPSDGDLIRKEAIVGVGNRLLPVATAFHANGVTVPHGECPKVGLGGHSQTGGYGHLVRSFGLCLDFLYGFTIVTANGDVLKPNRDSTDKTLKDLFWAVRGGSPGAFGVTTELVFHPIVDANYPKSTGYGFRLIYTPELMKVVLDILQDGVNSCLLTDKNRMPDVDYTCTLGHKDGALLGISISAILVEMVVKDASDAKANEFFHSVIEKVEEAHSWWRDMFGDAAGWVSGWKKNIDGRGKHVPLSEMSLHFVRAPPAVTDEGRENANPYDKAMYGTYDKLSPNWSTAYCQLLDDVVKNKNKNSLVFQVVVGGGGQQEKGLLKDAAIAHRNNRVQLVFDLFRPGLTDPIMAGVEFQRRFLTDIVEGCMMGGNPKKYKVMMQWASSGDLDMSKESVWRKYFDQEATYRRVRQIKADVDPTNLFRSRFTVPPAAIAR